MRYTIAIPIIAVMLVLLATALYSCQEPRSPGPDEPTPSQYDNSEPVIQYKNAELPPTGGMSLGV